MYKKITLKNNLRLILVPLPDSRSINVSFYVKAGSRFEHAKNNGIAHFLEHMAFKGTEEFKTQLDLAKFVEGFGGNWNASTSSELIKYYIKAEASHVTDAIHILDQMLFHPLFSATEIEKEKNVIIEEINMYNDVPEYRVGILMDLLMWGEHPLGRNIAGTKETVSSFVRDDFVSYKKSLYAPSNIVIGVSGKFDEKAIEELINQKFGNLEDRTAISYEPVTTIQKEPRIAVEERESEQSHLCLNFRGFSHSDPKKYVLTLISVMLGGGISSRLFQKIRTELSLAYYVGANSYNYMDVGIFQISAGVSNATYLQAISSILLEIKKFVKEGVEEEELVRSKEHLKGLLALSLEDHQKQNSFLCEQELLKGGAVIYDDVVKKIDAVTLEDVAYVASEVFVNESLNLALVGKAKEPDVREVTHWAR